MFPELKIFASLYDGPADEHAYYQDFRRERGGYYDIPRISSGYVPDQSAVYGEISAINDLGVFNHFIHPDEMFYEEVPSCPGNRCTTVWRTLSGSCPSAIPG